MKKPKAAKKIKEVTDEQTDGEVKKVKKIAKEKVVKIDADSSVVKPVKKTKAVKAVDTTAPTTKSSRTTTSKTSVPSSSSADNISDGDFDGNDMFDLKELLGDDFLSEGLLPNLDDDLAKLEANLGELGDFGFDFKDDDDDDEALRSIESGKFDIEEFLKEGADELDDILSALPTLTKKGAEYGALPPTTRSKKSAETSSNKKKGKAVQPTLQQAMKVVEEDDDDDEGMEDDSVSDQVLEELALSLGLGGDDLIDVSNVTAS